MQKFLIPAALAIALGTGATVAMADSAPDKIASTAFLSMAQVTSRLEAQGLTVRKIKFDDGRYKVKATDSSGHKQKLSVSPTSGDVISKDIDDDDD